MYVPNIGLYEISLISQAAAFDATRITTSATGREAATGTLPIY